MHDVILRNAADRCSQLSQYVREQPEVDVHVNRFVNDRLKLARLLFKCNNARLARCATGRQHFASQPCICDFFDPLSCGALALCRRMPQMTSNATETRSPRYVR